jgi:hypothetical protein
MELDQDDRKEVQNAFTIGLMWPLAIAIFGSQGWIRLFHSVNADLCGIGLIAVGVIAGVTMGLARRRGKIADLTAGSVPEGNSPLMMVAMVATGLVIVVAIAGPATYLLGGTI